MFSKVASLALGQSYDCRNTHEEILEEIYTPDVTQPQQN